MADPAPQKPQYVIHPSKVTDTCWEVENSSTKHGARIQLWNTHGPNATWHIDYTELGRVVITNVLSGLVVGLRDKPGNGAKLVQLDRNLVGPERYEFTLHSDRERPDLQFFSLAAHPLYRIECEDGNLGDGTALQLWDNTLERTLWHLQTLG